MLSGLLFMDTLSHSLHAASREYIGVDMAWYGAEVIWECCECTECTDCSECYECRNLTKANPDLYFYQSNFKSWPRRISRSSNSN